MIRFNTRAPRAPYPADLKAILSVDRALESQEWLAHWPRITPGATPLYALPDAADRLKVASVQVKDEGLRSDLGSFKALGAPIALIRLIRRRSPDFTPKDLFAGVHRGELDDFTVISATDGNHGRALAAAAESVGCPCKIVLHGQVSEERERAIAAYGAEIIRIAGNYDQSVEEAARLASANGWRVVSDTSYEGYQDVPRDVMQGYAIIAAEVAAASQPPFSHVILQAGVGGFAAGVASYFWELQGTERPTFIVVEPSEADCLYESVLHGAPARATGSTDSVMAGLACGEPSPLAWAILDRCVDAFMKIDDEDAVQAMRDLATGGERDQPFVAGESGAAGFAALKSLRSDAAASAKIGLSERSRVLLINTEGATAPSVYRDLVGLSADEVLAGQAAWRTANSGP